MKLLGSPASPYVRKCRVAVTELGLSDKVEMVHASTAPIDPNAEIKAANPVVKIPTLILDSGEALFDSRIIMRYLDDQTGGSLYPAGDWSVQRRESQAEGLLDAALLLRYETFLRPEDKRWDDWIKGQSFKISNVLDAMENEVSALSGVDAAAIGTGCALGYLDFRFSEWLWRDNRPALAAWFEEFSQRPSMQSSKPE
ncbi:MAG TPA: glutathione S-transferase [Alphaproteobacteria bacterium]|nr:glutathione S-transferase [Alphaproteobacteria bacterium]